MHTDFPTPSDASAPVRRLAAITCYFNPQGYRRPRENFDRFRSELQAQGVELWTAELAFGDAPFVISDARLALRGEERHMLWQKERLLNLLIERLPADVDAVAWLDADILFRNPGWARATCRSLERFAVVQPFEWSRRIERDGALGPPWRSTGAAHAAGDPRFADFTRTRPGLACAARADWLHRCGLYDAHIAGGSDSLMIQAFARTPPPIHRPLTEPCREHLRRWVETVSAAVAGRFGGVPGGVWHLYHGEISNRQYVARWNWLTDHHFDPATDVELDSQGLWQWTSTALRRKPELIRLVRDFFRVRNEDE